ncbi:MAG: FimB/Mfa2 family fimbrial subunit, partial [Muribaculaceae bacterium]|nr:FimB/Mfa2 family fimbrial subunit [Muribaculaceae bacterium]
MKGPDAKLSITRTTDGEEIVNIPLVDYLLLVRNYYGNMPDQEYLDRQDDYSIT